jgi:two-component system, OmpR family, sensor histidine kinase VanS
VSARLRLTLSYAAFLVAAGAVTSLGVYIVLRYVPNYPLTAANPRDPPVVASRPEILHAVVTWSAAILGVLAAVGLAGGWLIAGWVLRPLHDIDTAVRLAASGRLDHRIRLSGRRDEFRRLADAFDHMLGRLDDTFATQQRFAANASHELRTPLTVTATLIDVARADPDAQDYPELLERLRITNRRAIGLTEALLRLAAADAAALSPQPLDLAAIAGAAVAENADEAEQRAVTLDARLDPAPTAGDATLLGQLAENLVQNALRHNVAPGRAEVSTRRDASAVTLRVENTGARYSDEMAAQLSEPFLRGAGRASGGGYGLGLALVSRIAALHDGTLTIEPRAGGGLVATVTLPMKA